MRRNTCAAEGTCTPGGQAPPPIRARASTICLNNSSNTRLCLNNKPRRTISAIRHKPNPIRSAAAAAMPASMAHGVCAAATSTSTHHRNKGAHLTLNGDDSAARGVGESDDGATEAREKLAVAALELPHDQDALLAAAQEVAGILGARQARHCLRVPVHRALAAEQLSES